MLTWHVSKGPISLGADMRCMCLQDTTQAKVRKLSQKNHPQGADSYHYSALIVGLSDELRCMRRQDGEDILPCKCILWDHRLWILRAHLHPSGHLGNSIKHTNFPETCLCAGQYEVQR